MFTAIRNPTVHCRPPPQSHSVEIDFFLVSSGLSLIPSDMILIHVCVFWRVSLNTLVKQEDTRSMLSAPHTPTPQPGLISSSVGGGLEINGPCCSPGVLLFSNSFCGPVGPRSHTRTDYTPVRHCSEPDSGFALSGRALIITVQETSNTSPIAFDGV